MTIALYAAVDVLGGRCVRLLQGDYGQATVYGDDPVAVAKELVEGGAPWLHVVDLDAARTGRPENRAVVAAIAGGVDVPVQSGGGVRDEDAAEALLEAGVDRVVIGTAAVERPELVDRLAARHPGRVAVGLDARRGELAVHGWTRGSGIGLHEALARFEDAGVAAAVVTDVTSDGTLVGPDVAALAGALQATSVPVVASGGVGSLADLRALAGLEAGGRRLAGVVVGKALYEGAFTMAEAVRALTGGPPA